MHTDSSKKLRAMARSALKELGDRSLSIIDAKDEEIYMQFRVCSQTLTEVTFSALTYRCMLNFLPREQKSEYFRKMLHSDMYESSPNSCIKIVVDSPQTFYSIIEYFYTDQVKKIKTYCF